MQLYAQKHAGDITIVILTLWLLATILNLNKAFHIDDTFHLEAAQWIEQNPMRPMSGLINWDNNSIPMYHYNQPPLYFYMIALAGSLFGYSEIPLHLFQSLFTLLAIICFYRIAEALYPRHALILTALLVLNPAFLVNQNMMADRPLLSLHLLFIYILIKPGIKSAIVRYTLAAAVLSIALLIKYTSLPLVVLLLLTPLIKREKKYIVIGFIPVFILGLWSVFNYIEYGSVHLHGRPANTLSFSGTGKQLLSFILCLGAVAPFTIAFVTGVSEKYRRTFTLLTVLSVSFFLGVALLWYLGIIPVSVTQRILWYGFVINGLVALILALNRRSYSLVNFKVLVNNANTAILILWGGGLGAFIVLFAPFMATRHVLLVIPAILLLSAGLLNVVSSRIKILAIAVSMCLSLLLGVSDWLYADFYRKQAYEIKAGLPESATVWAVGHWGWQWYSKAVGMQQYESNSDKVAVSDYIVVPKNVAQQVINDKLVVEEVKSIVPPSNPLTYFSTGTFATFYTSDYLRAPWTLTKAPVDTIKILRVTANNTIK